MLIGLSPWLILHNKPALTKFGSRLRHAIKWHQYYRVFSLTWPVSMQMYWNKRKPLHKKRVQIPQDWFGTPKWRPFYCFGTPIWLPWRHVKTLYTSGRKNVMSIRELFCPDPLAEFEKMAAFQIFFCLKIKCFQS